MYTEYAKVCLEFALNSKAKTVDSGKVYVTKFNSNGIKICLPHMVFAA